MWRTFSRRTLLTGARGGAVGWCTSLQTGRSRFRFSIMSLELFIDIILPAVLGPAIDSTCNRNEYHEYFMWGEGGRCLRRTSLPHSCTDFYEICEPSTPGTHRACTSLYRVDHSNITLNTDRCMNDFFRACLYACLQVIHWCCTERPSPCRSFC